MVRCLVLFSFVRTGFNSIQFGLGSIVVAPEASARPRWPLIEIVIIIFFVFKDSAFGSFNA